MPRIFNIPFYKGTMLDSMGSTITKSGTNNFKQLGKGFSLDCIGSNNVYSEVVTGIYNTIIIEFYLNNPITSVSAFNMIGSLSAGGWICFGSVSPDFFNETFSWISGITADGGYIRSNFSKGYNQIILRWNGTRYDCYLNGISVTVYDKTVAPAPTVISNAAVYLGKRQAAAQYFTGNILNFEIYDHSFSTTEVARKYNEFINRSPINPPIRGLEGDFKFIDKFERCPADGKTIYAPQDWRVLTGSWKVSESATAFNKAKYLENVTASSGLITESNVAYGEWLYKFNKKNSTANIILGIILSNTTSILTGTSTGYAIYINSENRIGLNRFSGGGANTSIFTTDVNYIADNTEYEVKVIRSAGNSFSIYIKGGIYTTFTLCAATGGSNPVVDATYTTSKAISIETTSATESKIASVNIKPL